MSKKKACVTINLFSNNKFEIGTVALKTFIFVLVIRLVAPFLDSDQLAEIVRFLISKLLGS